MLREAVPRGSRSLTCRCRFDPKTACPTGNPSSRSRLYNGLPYIDETLRSVFGQTCQDFEIVIVDDGSTDGSADFIERQFPDARIRIVRQKNQTLRVARPVAVAHARGRFIAFVDHDDVWLAEKLERQLAVACSSPEIGLVFSDC